LLIELKSLAFTQDSVLLSKKDESESRHRDGDVIKERAKSPPQIYTESTDQDANLTNRIRGNLWLVSLVPPNQK
jgi:hypothetical protein